MNDNKPYQSFTELTVWQVARALKNEVYELAKRLPADERFRLADQLIRASRSICANIAEGHGRYTYKEQSHFCIQARGSLSEVQNHLIDVMDCKYLSKEEISSIESKVDDTGKLLNGYITFLRNNINNKE
ncbi:four helix bundle protein [Chitinophagaceae bacterium IBVUCB1]|nr:four helix bundle protein [Chitinophagaceae bacterium IBVUCB1]